MADNNTTESKYSHNGMHEYPTVHSIRTHVIKYGRLDYRKRLVVVIPGNPGAIGFYEKFMLSLYEGSGWPVWGLSYAGHCTVPKHVEWKTPNCEVFTLEGQIDHKVSFINEHVPQDVEIVLIGHSIGARVILEIMERLHHDKVRQGMMLFPTLEKMAESPRGRRITPMLKYCRWLLVLLTCFLWLIPFNWKTHMISSVFSKRRRTWKRTIPDCIENTVHSIIHPYCVWNTTYMAHIEMQQVVHLNVPAMKRHIHKLRFYYGATDHWCPQDHYYRMKELFPFHDKIELCTSGFRHAFIIDASEPMAEKVSDWLQLL